ncbi:alcohol oxidase [Meira miltonrushii]|uniref:Alcohol oxidase n=1 Tax=Meira miltonrushii TaxID=1280837 RepID=A0A316VBQ6_9BASI|nr:alcohol oxidase [Meira miltonrushii]PWN33411.1 alcohol oxidase [Meira miltonrushii]
MAKSSRLSSFILITFAILISTALASTLRREGVQFGKRQWQKIATRDVTGDGSSVDGQTFDYIIVGGGLAGLTVANRISEDPAYSVLVIEAGPDIYGADQSKFLVPAGNLYNTAVGTQYDWQWLTSSQSNLNGRQLHWPRGKVLGGSSSINGLYMIRASKIEHDAWASLNNATDKWDWDHMLAAMKKSEDFQEPAQQVRQAVPSLGWDSTSHGTDGPVHVGWPAVSYPAIEGFLQGNAQTGTPISVNPDNGESWGAFVGTSAIDNSNWQRSSSRTAYLNGADQRPNLHVLTGNQVTKILTKGSESDGGVNATGVQFAQYSGDQIRTAYARREVILSGGAINSPALLQLSGIGDAQQLQNVGVDSVIDLPGVGHNVQDHLSWSISYAPGEGVEMPAASVTGNAQADSFVNSATSYVNTTTLFGADGAQQLINQARSGLDNAINSANVRDEVKAAYRATMNTQINDVFSSAIGPIEILHALTYGTIQLQVALQHPLSRGSILINSADPFNGPTIDPGYLNSDIDLQMLRAGFKQARKIGQSSAMSNYLGQELSPGPSTQSDAQWNDYIRNNVATEYHPSSGCSMLPRAQGGVVDPNLLVYGTKNLRVIDSSIPPLAVSAHLMTIVYGLAEIGSEIVINARQPPPSADNGQNNNNSSGNNGASGGNTNTDGGSGGNTNTGGSNLGIASSAWASSFSISGGVIATLSMSLATLLLL